MFDAEFREGAVRIVTETGKTIAQVADPADLARLQQIIGGIIERFAAREDLTVDWVPA